MCACVIRHFEILVLIRRNASLQHECIHTHTCACTFIKSVNTHTYPHNAPREALRRCCAREQSWAPPAWVLPLIPLHRPDWIPIQQSPQLSSDSLESGESTAEAIHIPFSPFCHYPILCAVTGTRHHSPLEAHLCKDIWDAGAQISIAANGWSTRASFEPFQRLGKPDSGCHLFSSSFTLEWHKIIGDAKTCSEWNM